MSERTAREGEGMTSELFLEVLLLDFFNFSLKSCSLNLRLLLPFLEELAAIERLCSEIAG